MFIFSLSLSRSLSQSTTMADEKSVLAVIRAARPSFRNASDKMAFAVHSSFLASGYLLHSTGPPAFSDNALSSSSTDEVGIDNWNEFEDDYAFLYSNPEKDSKKVLVKCVAMNDKLLVDALKIGSSEPAHLQINIPDYDKENGGTNYGEQYKNLDKLVSSIDKEILSKLNRTSTESSSTQPSSSRTRDVEVTEPPIHRPQPPPAGLMSIWLEGITAQYQVSKRVLELLISSWMGNNSFDGRPNDSMILCRIVYPPVYPVGGSDLFPGPGAGMYPTRGDFGIGGGGMFVGPEHPMFGGMGRGIGPILPGGLPGVPPGARFDPYGPPGIPGFEPNRFARDPRRPGRGTHPDLEHYRDGSDYI
ncbi:unnamed protein product [Camellia sinensis]